MRLTLRTMLAYLDDILEPEDAEDIGKKITESDFATSLVHRTRDCVRRQRLGTPAVEGKGLAADGNTVAEYLDNTLEAERVPEFEKVCLESDVHLAEVASCHQILTLVLGEPVEIDPASRDRMYQMIVRGGKQEPKAKLESVVQPAHRTPAPSDTPESIPGRKHRPEVPDYLRESAKARRWPLVSTIAVAAVVTLAILLVAGPPGLREQFAGLFGGAKAPELEEAPRVPVAATTDSSEETPEEAGTASDETTPSEPLPSEESPAEPSATDSESPGPITVPQPSEDLNEGDAAEPPMVPGDSTDAASIPKLPVEPGTTEEAPPVPGDSPVEPTEEAPPTPANTEPGAPSETEPDNANPLRPAKPLDIAAAAGVEIGRYLTDEQVSVQFDREAKAWKRLPARAVLASGDCVLTLPAFRPAFALANGVTIHAASPSQLTFEGLDENGVPVVAVEFGRMGLLTVGKAGNQVHLRLGDRDVLVTFLDAQSTLALEVVSKLPPGRDPEAGPPDLAVDLYATSGQIAYAEAGKEQVVKAPEHATLTEISASGLGAGVLPDWATREVANPLDERAAIALEKELTFDRPLSLAIKELSQNRRAEVRALAIRCGGYLGDFEAFVTALNDADQRASWPAQVESLKAAIARGPQTAAVVRETLEKQRGDDAKSLYRLLWGFTPNQLQDGDATRLVDELNNEALDIRVLAFWNLQNITGKSLFYRPESPEAKRRAALTKWRELLEDGKIVPAAPVVAPAKSVSLRTPQKPKAEPLDLAPGL